MRKTDDETILRMLKEGKQQKEIAEHFGVSPASICKRVKRICLPESLTKLTEKEQKFALQVAKGATKTNAALAAFDTESPNSARALGNKLSKKPSVSAAIADLMDYHGLTRSYLVEKLKTHVDNVDPNVSLKALDQSWKLDGAYTEEKPDIVINHHEQLAILNVELINLHREELRLRAELLWAVDGKITDKEYKELLQKIHSEKNEFEIDNLYRHLLELSGIPESEIEAEIMKFNGGMTGLLNECEMDAEFENES